MSDSSMAPLRSWLSAPLDRDVSEALQRIRTAKYTVDGGARGMREVFRSVSWPPRFRA
jgi:hypothetical protein